MIAFAIVWAAGWLLFTAIEGWKECRCGPFTVGELLSLSVAMLFFWPVALWQTEIGRRRVR